MNPGAKDFNLWKACLRKRAYPTAAAAFQKGQATYHCRHCGQWHRRGALLIAQLKRA